MREFQLMPDRVGWRARSPEVRRGRNSGSPEGRKCGRSAVRHFAHTKKNPTWRSAGGSPARQFGKFGAIEVAPASLPALPWTSATAMLGPAGSRRYFQTGIFSRRPIDCAKSTASRTISDLMEIESGYRLSFRKSLATDVLAAYQRQPYSFCFRATSP